MKEKIQKLRNEGKSYKQIVKELGCSIATVCYHCGEGQKAKNKFRSQKNRQAYVLCKKLDAYCRKQLQSKADDFQRERTTVGNGRHLEKTFGYKDVLEKFGNNPTCYLTGTSIDLLCPKTYSFDHIIPPHRGGDNSLPNLGLTCKKVNMAKNDMLVEEFLQMCKEVLIHHGFDVRKK